MKKMRLLCLALTVSLFALFVARTDATSSTEIAALNSFFTATNGPFWKVKTNWGNGDPCTNSWYGVVCASGFISQLNLKDNGLAGTIPTNFSQLTNLDTLDLSFNSLSGYPLPLITGLSALRTLNLQANMLSGSFPTAASIYIPNLNLQDNQFYGTFPSSSSPQYIRLKNNQFTGPLPTSVTDSTTLRVLDIANNRFSGNLPFSSKWKLLEVYDASNNSLTGTLPDLELIYLSTFKVSNSNIAGTIPNSLFRSFFLEEIDLSNNHLTGTIPPLSSRVSSFHDLNLSGNQLTGPIPSSYFSPTLRNLNLSQNQLNGTVSFGSNLLSAESIDLSSNNLHGTLPVSLNFQSALIRLKLDRNSFSGPIPQALSNFYNLKELTLENNNLNGTLPEFLQTDPGYQVFDSRYNAFLCPLPAWCSAPPAGNGKCTPCSDPSEQLFCCAYSSNGCKTISNYTCEANNCAASPGGGLKLCGLNPTPFCSQCANDFFFGAIFPSTKRPSVVIN